jgi:hypothetical protein
LFYVENRLSGPTVAAHLRGGWGDEPPRPTSAVGPAHFATEHDSRVRCSRRLGDFHTLMIPVSPVRLNRFFNRASREHRYGPGQHVDAAGLAGVQ